MRKTPGINPLGLEKDTWNYRVRQLRRALGWSMYKLARIMKVTKFCVWSLENGLTKRPNFSTIRAIKAVEDQYPDVIEAYKKHPERMNRLVHFNKRKSPLGGVNLLPITVRRSDDLETLDDVGTSSEELFFGRKTRRYFRNTGIPPREALRRQRISQTKLLKNAEIRAAKLNNKQT